MGERPSLTLGEGCASGPKKSFQKSHGGGIGPET